MTPKEFNEKWAQYLEEGHYGLDINSSIVIEYLDYIFSNALIKIEGFKYSQIKLKFGSARVYCDLSSDANDIIESAIDFLLNHPDITKR